MCSVVLVKVKAITAGYYCYRLTLVHTHTLKLSEGVLGVCHSPNGRLLAVALLDSTIKVFFRDTLKVRT